MTSVAIPLQFSSNGLKRSRFWFLDLTHRLVAYGYSDLKPLCLRFLNAFNTISCKYSRSKGFGSSFTKFLKKYPGIKAMHSVKSIISFSNCPPRLCEWITKLAWLSDQALKRFDHLSRGDAQRGGRPKIYSSHVYLQDPECKTLTEYLQCLFTWFSTRIYWLFTLKIL